MIVAPFVAEHAQLLAIQPREEMPALTVNEARALEAVGRAYTALDDHRRPIAICGIVPQGRPGECIRAIAWGLIGYNAGPHFVRITREVRKFLDTCGYRRVEASVDASFPEAIRWIELLGFERETPLPMRSYGFDGRAHFLYARVTDPA